MMKGAPFPRTRIHWGRSLPHQREQIAAKNGRNLFYWLWAILSLTGPYTAVRDGCANIRRSTSTEFVACGKRHMPREIGDRFGSPAESFLQHIRRNEAIAP